MCGTYLYEATEVNSALLLLAQRNTRNRSLSENLRERRGEAAINCTSSIWKMCFTVKNITRSRLGTVL